MKRILFLILLLPVIAEGQIITTIAGTGSSSYSGNGVPATTAGLNDPRGGAFDKLGNYYFADGTGANMIRKIDASGIISTIAGNGIGGFGGDGGQATNAKLNAPVAVALDSAGNIFIADIMNNRIRKVDITTGIINTVVGNGSSGYSGDGGLATNAMINGPDDISFDKIGNLYISGSDNRIRRVDLSGIISTIAGTGFPASSGDGGPATNAQINGPTGIVVDDNNNVFIAERGGNRIRKINSSGIISTYAGNGSATYSGDGIPATTAQIVPVKIGFNKKGSLFIAADFDERVFMVDSSGIIHSVAGDGLTGFSGDTGPATSCEFHTTYGISFDNCDNLFIPDLNNFRIRKVTFNPTCYPTLKENEIKSGNQTSIYPNPATTELTITSPNKITQLTITNLLGRQVYTHEYNTETVQVNVAGLPSGIYFIKINGTLVRRFVKE